MKLMNLTNRTITLLDENGSERFSIKPSGLVVAASVTTKVEESVVAEPGYHSVDIVAIRYGDVTTMPDPVEGVYYIVSYAVLQALAGSRHDVLAPDTSPGSVVRQEGGQKVLGVRHLRRL